jgi:hypothetical protein
MNIHDALDDDIMAMSSDELWAVAVDEMGSEEAVIDEIARIRGLIATTITSLEVEQSHTGTAHNH